MIVVALIMRPWVLMARARGARPKVLADDALLLVSARRMLQRFAEVLEATHRYLHHMGAKVAPAKNYNFASSRICRDWLQATWWKEIGAHIDVVGDFRYLGAHLCTQGCRQYHTISKRAKQAIEWMRKVRFVVASPEAKAKTLRTKVFPAMLYGVEVNDLTERQLRAVAAAVIDVFKGKNNHHDADLFFASLACGTDLDPVNQLLVRRCMELRRCVANMPYKEEELRRTLLNYVRTAKDDEKPAEWFRQEGMPESEQCYPEPAAHPTKNQPATWKTAVAEKGPIGLLIQAVARAGCQIDEHFRVWQKKEVPVSITSTPYQFLA